MDIHRLVGCRLASSREISSSEFLETEKIENLQWKLFLFLQWICRVQRQRMPELKDLKENRGPNYFQFFPICTHSTK